VVRLKGICEQGEEERKITVSTLSKNRLGDPVCARFFPSGRRRR